jgi:iron complex outermembrane receptor protein
MKLKILSVALAAMPCAAFAADEANTLDAVVVTGRSAAERFRGDAVDGAEIRAQRAATSDTASLLRDVPGVSLYGAGGVSSLPAIHGLADDRVRIKVDGMDLIASCPNHMNPALSYLDPTGVETLKVYAGIAPVSVGGDSIGGTIIAETAAPEFAAPGQGSLIRGQLGAFYRSNNNARGGNIAATYATESFNLSYGGATSEADNYKAAGDFKTSAATGRGTSLPLDEVGSTAYKTTNHTLGLALKGGDHLVEARLGFQDMPKQLYPNQRMDLLDNTQQSLNLRYLGQLDWGTLEARAYHETVRHFMDFGADKQYFYGTAPNIAPGMPMYTKGKTTGVAVKARLDLSEQDLLRLGGDYQSYRLNDWWPPSPPDRPAFVGGMSPNTFWNINDGKRDRLGVFAEWEARWNPRWLTMLGARVEQVKTDTGQVQGYNNAPAPSMYYTGYLLAATSFNALDRKRTDSNLDLTALARHTPDASRSLEFGYARKTRSPNLYERYSWSRNAMALVMNNFVGDGNGYLGNPDLKPEVAHTLSVTGDWHDAAHTAQFKITPYYTHVSGYIDAVQWDRTNNVPLASAATRQFVTLKYMNQSARLYGIDVSGLMPLAKTGMGELGLKGLLNYTNGKNRDTGDDLYNIMPLNATLTLTQKLGGWDNGIELVMVQAKDKVSDARNEIKTAGYGLMNLRGSYSWKQTRVDFGIENLFDKYYFLPTGGAYAGQGSTMSINGIPWGIAVPGMGRSIYAGVNHKF